VGRLPLPRNPHSRGAWELGPNCCAELSGLGHSSIRTGVVVRPGSTCIQTFYQQGWRRVARTEFAEPEATTRGSCQGSGEAEKR
jgi:heme/copper-type cytochrome/quinol oxidase subunit 2